MSKLHDVISRLVVKIGWFGKLSTFGSCSLAKSLV